jgi:hypothetical protein
MHGKPGLAAHRASRHAATPGGRSRQTVASESYPGHVLSRTAGRVRFPGLPLLVSLLSLAMEE